MNENFNFETSPFVSYAVSDLTDGTANPQIIGSDFDAFAHNGASPTPWAEPEKLISVFNEGHLWDRLTRMLIFTQRQAGTGTWTGKLQVTRTGGSAVDLVTGIDFPLASGAAANVTVVDGGLPRDFLKDGTPLMTDEASFTFRLTALGQATAVNVMAMVMFLPGFVAAESNKGAVLSAPKFLTIR